MDYKWWHSAVFYQIYPRSFADGNGDGIGDFIGMTQKIGYLKELGIDAIWLSPHFPSSNWDVGYDIKDYCDVAPEYGTLEDFKQFLAAAHQAGIKLILDLVANHTSDEHPWFVESRESRDNPKADWYVWADTPPNNWQSCFDGDAWTYCPQRDQYYYHFFMKQQPDLNWRNPEVINAMWQVVRFWLDLGVDGYRLDAIGTLYEDTDLTPHSLPYSLADVRKMEGDAITTEEQTKVSQVFGDLFKFQVGHPDVHDRMKELRLVLDEYNGDRMLVGEDENPDYLGNGHDELHLVFNFPMMRSDGPLTPMHIINNQTQRLSQLANVSSASWPCNTLGNHDSPRVYNRYGDGKHDAELARISIALMLTLKGTPFLYNGEEIGMTDLIIEDAGLLRDTMATWYYNEMVKDPKMDKLAAARKAGIRSRDKNRTPIQWNDEENAGFSAKGVTTWLPINPNFQNGINVASQENDPNSLLTFYTKMLRLRNNNLALKFGEYDLVPQGNEKVFCFTRAFQGNAILIAINFSASQQKVQFAGKNTRFRTIIFSSAQRAPNEVTKSELVLGSFEILLLGE